MKKPKQNRIFKWLNFNPSVIYIQYTKYNKPRTITSLVITMLN